MSSVPWPAGLGVVDTMIGLPSPDPAANYSFFRDQIKDPTSKANMFPVEYLFKGNVPGAVEGAIDPVAMLVGEMDRFGIERGLIGVGGEHAARALKQHPDRFIPSGNADCNDGMKAVHEIQRQYETFGIRAVGMFPAGCHPQEPINGKRWYPIYSKCAELGIPVFVCAGIPGPRLPSMCQHVEYLDEVCYDFPELTIVTRHGCQPWTELAVKLMLKWPNLYYSTSAFAPQHYDPRIIDYANTRGADKIIFAGYYPMGLTLERIWGDMPHVPFKPHVWPKFLRENALRVLGVS
jgi:uncharacterized protein